MKYWRIYKNEVRWMFVVVFACVIHYLQFLMANANEYIITLFLLIQVIVLMLLRKRYRKVEVSQGQDRNLFWQTIAISLIVPILLSIVFFIPDMKTSGEVERHSPVLTLYVYSNHYIDHTNHIHMTRYISATNQVPYFSEPKGLLISDFLHYPQLVHTTHSTIYDGLRIGNAVVGQPVSNLSLLYFSYHLIFFLMLGMSAALLWYVAKKHIRPRLEYFNSKLFSAITGVVICAAVLGPLMSYALYGFFTQAAAELIILLSVLVFLERNREVGCYKWFIPLALLNIAMGNVWWVLLIPLFFATSVAVVFTNVSKSKAKSVLIKTSLLTITFLLSVIPAFVMVFISEKSIRTQTVLDGPYEPISFRLMFLIYAIGLALILGLMKAKYNRDISPRKNIVSAARTWLILPIALNGFVIAYVIYQLIEIDVVNYYGNKLMWSSVSVTIIAIAYCLGELFGEKRKLWNWSNLKIIPVIGIIMFFVVASASTWYVVHKQQLILAGVLPQEKRLAGLVKFLEQNTGEEFYVINSEFNFTEDYIAQRFAYIVRPTYEENNLLFLSLNNYGSSPERSEIFTTFLKQDRATSVVSLRGCFPVENLVENVNSDIEVFEITESGKVIACD